MPRRALSHTADSGIEASAPDLAGLVAEFAAGMWELVATVEPCVPTVSHVVTVAADTEPDLVVDTLSELLFRADTEGIVYCAFDVVAVGALQLRITAGGVSYETVELTGPPIKAVTYHELEVLETPDGGRFGRIYFDV